MTLPADPKDFMKRYGPEAGAEGPVRFVKEIFQVTPDPWQVLVLEAFGRGDRRIAVRSCHGVGKTAVASWIVILMLLTRLPQKTVATAPTSSQLEGALLPEIKMWFGRLPATIQQQYDVKAKGIYLKANPAENFFEARTSRADAPEALQGVHSDHVLLLGDEASGIPEAVFNAAVGSMSSDHATTLLIGNPVRTSGLFFEAFHRLADMWTRIHVSHQDSPRVTDDFVEQIRRTHGEDSAEFRVRCLGEFPKSDDDTLIPYEWVRTAVGRDIIEAKNVRRVWGVDVARFGSDRTAVVERTPRTARVVDAWGATNLMDSASRIKRLYDDTPDHQKPAVLLVDDIGMGSGVLDRLRQLGLPARGINVAETAAMNEKFNRSRSELWWRGREWFQGMNVRLAEPATHDMMEHQNVLLAELVVVKYSYTETGKITVESKSELRKRINKSPDFGDAFILTFAEDLTNAAWGSSGKFSDWDTPITRGLSIV